MTHVQSFSNKKNIAWGVVAVLVLLVAATLMYFWFRPPQSNQADEVRWVKNSRGIWVVAEGDAVEKPEYVRQQEFLILEAKLAYSVLKDSGTDLSSGPCLGPIFQDWVADVAHDPRLPVDDLPENQCADVLNGDARNFIELTPEGEVIRVFSGDD